jgi:hypothetical protein
MAFVFQICTILNLILCGQAKAALHPIEMAPLEKMPFSLVEVKIKGHGTTKMIVDTGASETVLADWFVKDSRLPYLPRIEEGSDSGGEKFKAVKSAPATLQVGRRSEELDGMYVIPTPKEFKELGIGGIFSPQTFFDKETFMLDFPSNRILSGKYSRKWVRGKRKIENIKIEPCSIDIQDKYVMKAMINGVPGSFYIDTGGVRSAITKSFKAKLGSVQTTRSQRMGVGSVRETERIEDLTLKLGKNVRKNIVADVEPERVACPFADGKLGNDFLKHYSLLFDKKRKSITLFK